MRVLSTELPDGLYLVESRVDEEGRPMLPLYSPVRHRWSVWGFGFGGMVPDHERSDMLKRLSELDREEMG